MNNVGRGSFGIGQVQRALFEALTTLKAKMVRVNQDGREVNTECYFVVVLLTLLAHRHKSSPCLHDRLHQYLCNGRRTSYCIPGTLTTRFLSRSMSPKMPRRERRRRCLAGMSTKNLTSVGSAE